MAFDLSKYIDVLLVARSFIIAAIVFIILYVIIQVLRNRLMMHVKSKAQVHNVKVFSSLITYTAFVIVIILAILSYAGSWSGFGLGVGLFTAALGWALQKPITGIAAWLMVVFYKPFRIGDRVVIGGVRGDVVDIRLTHIYISEVGGIVSGEENSNRVILVPNSTLFDTSIINYTGNSDYVLDQVSFLVTFASNIDKVKQIVLDEAREKTGEVIKTTGKEPYTRIFFSNNGMSVQVRYMSPAVRLQEVSGALSESILKKIQAEKDIELAYPITRVLLDDLKGDAGRKE